MLHKLCSTVISILWLCCIYKTILSIRTRQKGKAILFGLISLFPLLILGFCFAMMIRASV